MERKIIFAFILGAIISSVVGVIAANTISSSPVIYKDDRTVNTVLDELFENVDAIESDDTRLTSLEGKVNTLTSTHSSDITRIDNNITNINNKIGSMDISSVGDGTITGAINLVNSILKKEQTNSGLIISNISTGTITINNAKSNGTTANIGFSINNIASTITSDTLIATVPEKYWPPFQSFIMGYFVKDSTFTQ